MKSNKYLALIKDMVLFGLSSFIPKAISFFLVPLYTNCLTTYEFGIFDIILTSISLIYPVITFGVDNALLRFTIDNKSDHKPYIIAMKIALKGILFILSLIIFNVVIGIFDIPVIYQLFFIISYILYAFLYINNAYLRAVNKIEVLATSTIINSILTISLNVITLVFLKWGIKGYLLSNVLGLLITNIFVFVKIDLQKYIKLFKIEDTELQKRMIKYSFPLAVSCIAWWFVTASDRYVITFICGVAASGIYSVAGKIPTILYMMQSVFSQAWLLAVYREYKTEGGKEFTAKIYDLYNGFLIIGCGILIFIDIPISKFLFAKDFFAAWQYVPFLLIAMVCNANAAFFENFLTLFKKTKLIAKTSVIGGLSNIVLNFACVMIMGPLGASVATLVSYLIICFPRVYYSYKLYPFYINWIKHIAGLILLVIESVILIISQNYFACALILLIMVIINIKTITSLVNEFKTILKARICKK